MDALEQRDKEYESLYKQMDIVLSDYKMETKHLVEVLQKHRDEQVSINRI